MSIFQILNIIRAFLSVIPYNWLFMFPRFFFKIIYEFLRTFFRLNLRTVLLKIYKLFLIFQTVVIFLNKMFCKRHILYFFKAMFKIVKQGEGNMILCIEPLIRANRFKIHFFHSFQINLLYFNIFIVKIQELILSCFFFFAFKIIIKRT